jgi:hypothetical protein
MVVVRMKDEKKKRGEEEDNICLNSSERLET